MRQNETHEGRIIAQTCVDIFVKNGSNRQWLRETFLRITAIICQVFQLLCYIIIVWHGKSCRLTMLGYRSSNLGALIMTNRNNLYRYHELCTQLNQHQRYRLKHNHFKIHRCKYRHQRSLPEPFDIYCLKRCCRKKTLAEPAKNTCWLLPCALLFVKNTQAAEYRLCRARFPSSTLIMPRFLIGTVPLSKQSPFPKFSNFFVKGSTVCNSKIVPLLTPVLRSVDLLQFTYFLL